MKRLHPTVVAKRLHPTVAKRLCPTVIAALALLTLLLTGAAPAAAAPTAPDVVVVGVTDLRWSAVSEAATPTLWRLASRGATGLAAIRSAANVTCPVDGWVTLGAGNRAEGPAGCRGSLPRGAWPEVVTRNGAADYGARPGALASTLASHGQCVDTIGDLAWLATGPPTGTSSGCPVTLVSADGAAAADRAAAAALAAHPDAVVLVVGLAQRTPGTSHLQVAIAAGGRFSTGELVSQSTRRAPYVQVIDVAPTVLALRGIAAPDDMMGLAWRSVAGHRAATMTAERHRLVDLARAADADRDALPWLLGFVIGIQLLGYAAAALLRRRPHRWARPLARAAGVWGVAVPGAGYVVQAEHWWLAADPIVALVGGTVGIAALFTAVALAGPWRRTALGPPTVAAAITALVVAVDVVRGSPWQIDAPFGYSPVVAGRFVGIGNVAYGIFATALLLAAAGAGIRLPRRQAAVLAGSIGVAGVVVDGAPQFGSDFGGVPALVLGTAVLVSLLAGRRISWRRLAIVIGVAAVAVTAFALLDYSRPPSAQTHLGRFVGTVLHGGGGTVIQRKATANWQLLTHNPVNALVPFLTAGLGWLAARPRGRLAVAEGCHPALRAGLLGVVTTGVLGFFLNDSGVAIPAMAMLVAIPFTIAVLAVTGVGDTPSGAPLQAPERPHVLP